MATTTRTHIASTVRRLRTERRWTQQRLASLLGLSQNRLSEIEHGRGSLSAEQLLTVLQAFNVPVDEFVTRPAKVEDQLQNALARLGAAHLAEAETVVPSDRLKEASDAVREALVSARSPRHITAIAPVLVLQEGTLNLSQLRDDLARLGLAHRLGWVVDSTKEALERELAGNLDRDWRVRYRRARYVLEMTYPGWQSGREGEFDVLDRDLTTPETIEKVKRELPHLARTWKIVTRLEVDDFVRALREARAG